jgi:hypothetical protein
MFSCEDGSHVKTLQLLPLELGLHQFTIVASALSSLPDGNCDIKEALLPQELKNDSDKPCLVPNQIVASKLC